MSLRVLLIDDHTLFRVGLEGLLVRRNIEVIASIGDSQEGMQRATALQPDIILLDMRMPDIDGIGVLKHLRSTGFKNPIVMLTTSTEERDLVESLRNGAQGYLLKDMEPDELVLALRDIVSGKTVVAPDLAPILAKVVQSDGTLPDETSPFDELTPRESEILSLVAEGQSNKVIARNLGISDGTVKLHVKAILRKLSVHSRVEAAVIAVEYGLRAGRNNTIS
ncbi:Nitrate/nitrite response regulator protein [hydrothermal vent metagenome]|uniref:Nitrate/nitrite response regulator protein n=1 Tax=hydrothermal vent metagenome TaxID=652676 RepID=A0A3B0Z5A0_9ZZZZ